MPDLFLVPGFLGTSPGGGFCCKIPASAKASAARHHDTCVLHMMTMGLDILLAVGVFAKAVHNFSFFFINLQPCAPNALAEIKQVVPFQPQALCTVSLICHNTPMIATGSIKGPCLEQHAILLLLKAWLFLIQFCDRTDGVTTRLCPSRVSSHCF